MRCIYMTKKEKEQLEFIYEQINRLKIELADSILERDFDSAFEYIERIEALKQAEIFLLED